ncbi:MAG TPA: FecR domain-containing protein [Pyrinomonadaceae bacterium]|jgi:ferric-dicitrate binding protein FerR (iron transport regulator)
MISRTWSRTAITLGLTVAVLCVSSMVALAAPGQQGPAGQLSVNGTVTVNGTNAISGATVYSDSTIATAQNSSAVVSLGKLGRVELLPNSSVKLSFGDGNVNAMLDSGRVRLATSDGVAATVTTKDGTAVADSSTPNVFTVDVECGNTQVATQTGRVELRADNKVQQVAAGSSAAAGQAAPGSRCTRLTREPTFGALSGGALAALLLAAGGAVAAAIIAASQDNDINVGGTAPIFSPSR